MSRLRHAHMNAAKAVSPHRPLPSRKPHVPRPPWAPVQLRATGVASSAAAVPNLTGLPDGLKAGIEALSGFSMDDVRVHRNSAEPARLGALAYAQGSDIHLGPGQDRHLPHEAWHVVQQKQGRVKPTLHFKALGLSDDAALEREADAMGARADRLDAGGGDAPAPDMATSLRSPSPSNVGSLIQRKVGFEIEVTAGIQRDYGRGGSSSSSEREPLVAPITKGETLFQGDGWRLTPDGTPEKGWIGEFITDPIDETRDAAQIGTVLADVADHAGRLDSLVLKRGYRVEAGSEILGSFHVTGGVRFDRLMALLEKAAAAGEDNSRQADEEKAAKERSLGMEPDENEPAPRANKESQILRSAAQAAGQAGGSPEYRGFVALLGSYVAGQQETQGRAPASGKHLLPILSRTNLGVIRSRVRMPGLDQFVADVVGASGIGPADGRARLFPLGLDAGEGSRRSIDLQGAITVREWLGRIYAQEDHRWSETSDHGGGSFAPERVGPIKSKWCGLSSTRALGAIVELRNVGQPVRPQRWQAFGKTLADIFTGLNAR
ncbi:MAG TPA: DUF4157 domain-containing protein [Allosphingosinicella sp.]|nr:DUF4157 domain-containing protein [Allosphingosinicella sp.]